MVYILTSLFRLKDFFSTVLPFSQAVHSCITVCSRGQSAHTSCNLLCVCMSRLLHVSLIPWRRCEEIKFPVSYAVSGGQRGRCGGISIFTLLTFSVFRGNLHLLFLNISRFKINVSPRNPVSSTAVTLLK